jgi:DNA-binding response OmpR family regulator
MARKRRQKTVLIIEDETDLRIFASRVLELEGYRVLKAIDGETGMEIIRENPVDIVLLDLRLPGRDGWSIINEIKHDAGLAAIPVIVITAVAESLQRKRTLRMGATRYLIKPLSAHNLARNIANILHASESRYNTTPKSAGAGD